MTPPLTRLPDWESRLLDWLRACEDRPFRWGAHDCCAFAAGAIEAQTGVDFYTDMGFAGAYSTERGAMRALKRLGHADLFGPFDVTLGERRAPLLLQRGDIVSDGQSIGVMWYRAGPCGLFVGQEDLGQDDGLIGLPLSSLKFGWAVSSDGPEFQAEPAHG